MNVCIFVFFFNFSLFCFFLLLQGTHSRSSVLYLSFQPMLRVCLAAEKVILSDINRKRQRQFQKEKERVSAFFCFFFLRLQGTDSRSSVLYLSCQPMLIVCSAPEKVILSSNNRKRNSLYLTLSDFQSEEVPLVAVKFLERKGANVCFFPLSVSVSSSSTKRLMYCVIYLSFSFN